MRNFAGRAFACSLCAVAPVPIAAEAPTQFVAYVERIYPTDEAPDRAFSVMHHGLRVNVGRNADLAEGDEIRVLDPAATVLVRTIATRELSIVRRHIGADAPRADFVVRHVDAPSTIQSVYAFLKLVSLSASQSRGDVGTASRALSGTATCYNDGGVTNQPIAFEIPILDGDRSYLASGSGRIFLAWRGGAPPFSVTLTNLDDRAVMQNVTGIMDLCSSLLPPTNIVAGKHYQLAVTDRNGVREEDNDIFGVRDAPAPPRPLLENGMLSSNRLIYYLTWLTMQDEGRWRLEAVRRAVGKGCAVAGVHQWLQSIAQSKECP